MKPEIAAKWTAALRSNKFCQLSEQLANAERTRHCCWGVLCELAITDGVDIEVDQEGDYTTYNLEKYHLPHSVVKWAELTKQSGIYEDELVSMNDDGIPFSKIADYIEKNLT